jgi:hypothetical protein
MLLRGLNLKIVQKRAWHPPPSNWKSYFGDYPKFPWSSIDDRSPYVRWDDPIHRRNTGEPIPEEFEIQDAFFPGDHSPWENLKKGMYGQMWVAIVAVTFGVAAYASALTKQPMRRELPQEVQSYLDTAGWDRVVKRPYEPIGAPPHDTFVARE